MEFNPHMHLVNKSYTFERERIKTYKRPGVTGSV